jgi:hypothetical protein
MGLGSYKTWILVNAWMPQLSQVEADLLEFHLKERKINILEGQDILCWGSQGSGKFSVKMEYYWEANHATLE